MQKSFNQKGQIFILAIIVLFLVMINTLVIISSAFTSQQSSYFNIERTIALNLAEAGVDHTLAALNITGGSFNPDPNSEIFFGIGSYTIKIIPKDATTNIVEVTGFVPNKTKYRAKKTVKIQISKGVGTSFTYGLQADVGGLILGNASSIIGSIYSNGDIIGGNTISITGDAWVAGGVQSGADQQSDCVGASCQDFLFGKNIAGSSQYDLAQSFQATTSGTLSKVSLKLKKIGSPSNLTVRLLVDDNGKPSKTVLTSGTLAANFVTSNYGFVDVSFSPSPTLSPNIPYWIMLDTCGNSTSACDSALDYWSWSMDNLQSYTRGKAAWSTNWQAGNAVWNNISGDLGFKTFMGGLVTKIDMGNNSVVSGNVHANTINGITINGDAYYKTITNSTVGGSSFPNSADPAPAPFPISDANITLWKSQAANGVSYGAQNGCNLTFESGKITGDLTLGSNCTVTIKSPLWITGNLTTLNNCKFVLSSSAGSSSGMIIVDGTISFGNSFDIVGSGVAGSYLMLLTTHNSQTSGTPAISTGNSSLTGVLYAPYGEVDLINGGHFKEISAWKIVTGNSAQLSYETGLSNIFFSSGPQGAFSIIKGTYQIQ